MEDVGCRARAVDSGCIGQVDADVVEHRRLVDEGAVNGKLGMSVHNLEGQAGHILDVEAENTLDVATYGVVLMDDVQGVNHRRWGA